MFNKIWGGEENGKIFQRSWHENVSLELYICTNILRSIYILVNDQRL